MVFEQKIINSFWDKVEKTDNIEDCWIWKSCRASSGYGVFDVNHQQFRAHRFSYILHYGNIIDSYVIRHKCNNILCCNPYHLQHGTQYDNIQDRVHDNRCAKGEKNGQSILTNDIVIELIIKIYNNEFKSIQEISKYYNVSWHTIRDVLHGKTWKHITSDLKVPLSQIYNMVRVTKDDRQFKINNSRKKYKKVSDIDIQNIYLRLDNGESAYSISKDFPISRQSIIYMKNHKKL